ncbi:hypothetical protein [Colwellia sp. PAMC 21821]|nr:hypothetical protein [Colwellia sp. PAMC 21821]
MSPLLSGGNRAKLMLININTLSFQQMVIAENSVALADILSWSNA